MPANNQFSVVLIAELSRVLRRHLRAILFDKIAFKKIQNKGGGGKGSAVVPSAPLNIYIYIYIYTSCSTRDVLVT